MERTNERNKVIMLRSHDTTGGPPSVRVVLVIPRNCALPHRILHVSKRA